MIKEGEDIDKLITSLAMKEPDFVEFRLDSVHDFEVLRAITQRKTFPAIATDRSDRDMKSRKKLLLTAVESGFEFVDVELTTPVGETMVSEIRSRGAEVIVSYHDSSGTPSSSQLRKILDAEIEAGGNICKIVPTAIYPRDNLTVLNFLENKPSESRVISFAMGALGTPSRILCPLFGSEFTFAALGRDSATAEGQLSIDDLRSVWKILGIQ